MLFWLKSKENLTLQINIWKREECLAFEIVVNFFWYYLNGSLLNVSCNVESETASVNFFVLSPENLVVCLYLEWFFYPPMIFSAYYHHLENTDSLRYADFQMLSFHYAVFLNHICFCFFVIYLVLTPFFYSILTFFFFWPCPVACGILLVPQPGIKPNSDFLISRFMFLLFHSSSGIWNKRRELFKGVV